MRVAIVGTAHVHVQDYFAVCRADPRIELVGISLSNDDGPFRPPPGVPVFARACDLPQCDLAIVVTDIASHDEIIQQISAPHLFVEKPLAASSDRARHLAKQLEARGANAQIGFFLRREPAMVALRDMVLAGGVGKICHASFSFSHSGLSQGWLRAWPAHLSPKRMGYGIFGDLAIHLVDFSQWIFGPVKPLACHLSRERESDLDTQGHAVLSAAGGAVIHLWAGGVTESTILELAVVGDRGAVTFREGVMSINAQGATVSIYENVSPTPAAGLRAVLDELHGLPVPAGVRLDEAVSASRILDSLHVIANSRK